MIRENIAIHRYKVFVLFIFILFYFQALSQTKVNVKADLMEYIEARFGKVRRLLGNVVVTQDNMTMYSDSAYQNIENNTVQAFNNIRIYQGDSVSMFGDKLDYDGNTKNAILTGKTVTLQDGTMTLTTDAIQYDAKERMGYYTTGGKIVNHENTMTSRIGTYNANTKTFGFKQKIVLLNPEYTMYCDTLQYNTVSQYAYFFGPTRIITTNDSTLIYCENGWYNTKLNHSQFSINSYIQTKDKKLSADSMVYTGSTGIDKAYRNILLVDTTNRMEIRGQLGTHNRKTNTSWVTKEVMGAIDAEGDTLFITADTLKTWFDSTRQNRVLYTYHHTKFYKTDLQGTCDSLQYSIKDSVINMEVNPVVWNDMNQITADTIRITMHEKQVDRINMYKNTFIAAKKDEEKYNQIKGRDAVGLFREKKLYVVNIFGDGESTYYIEEDTGKYMGVNKVACSNMKIQIDKNRVSDVHFYTQPSGTMYPLDKISPMDVKLKGFVWLEDKRPISKISLYK